MKLRLLAAILLAALGLEYWSSSLNDPWHLMYESSGQFMSGVARVHIEKGLGFTLGHDFIYNQDNPFGWRGPEPLEVKPYGHHPPLLGLTLAAIFQVFGQERAVARLASIASHLLTLVLLVLIVPRWSRGRLAAGIFAGLVVVLVPMSGFFARHVSQEAWLTPWIILAVATYVRRIERHGDGTPLEDGFICFFVWVAALFDWPGFYLPPILILFEAGRRRPFSRLNRWLFISTAVLSVVVLAHLHLALPGGIGLLLEGAEQRVDPSVLGFTWMQWLERVPVFTYQSYTIWALGAAGLAVAVWLARVVWTRRPGGPAAAFIAIFVVFGMIHIVAFPGGSWVHLYWMFYLMPAIAVAAGLAAGALWDAPIVGIRWVLRLVVFLWLVEILCESHHVLLWWLAAGAHPTGNVFVEWPRGSIPELLCNCARGYGFKWIFVCGEQLAGSLVEVAAAYRKVVAGFAFGGLLLAWLTRGGPARPILRDLVLLIALAAMLLPITPSDATHDAALRLAQLMVGGEVSLPERIPWLEMFRHGERFYFAYPPMTSFVLVPWVVLTGGHGTQQLVNMLFILASAVLLRRVVRGLDAIERYDAAAAAAYVLATPVVYAAAVGNVWLLMHSQANFFLLLALWLGYVRRAEGWGGFFLMVGAQCRYSVIFASLVFAYRFLAEAAPGPGRVAALFRRGLRFGLPMIVPLAATIAFQWGAFGDPLASGYTLGWREWGPHGPDFSIEYLQRNLWLYLLTPPTLQATFPFVRFEPSGQAIWFMSPFLLGAWLPRWRLPWVRHFLVGAVAMFAFYNLYWWTGFSQYGTRYMQDLLPLLVPLAFAGLGRPGEDWRRALVWLVALSIAINLWGAYVIIHLQR